MKLFYLWVSSPWKTYITPFCKFSEKKFIAKPKLFLNGYLLTGEKEMPKCLSTVTIVEMGRREKKWRKKKKNENKGWLVKSFFLKENDPFTLSQVESTCLSIQKNNVVSQKINIACNYKGCSTWLNLELD